jgi:hypothetical protein
MDYNLGRTGLKVSGLALGTMNFGELTDEPTSFAIMVSSLKLIETTPILLCAKSRGTGADPGSTCR